jgi:hypothetical protein
MERLALTVFFVGQIVPESTLEKVAYSRYDALSATGTAMEFLVHVLGRDSALSK